MALDWAGEGTEAKAARGDADARKAADARVATDAGAPDAAAGEGEVPSAERRDAHGRDAANDDPAKEPGRRGAAPRRAVLRRLVPPLFAGGEPGRRERAIGRMGRLVDQFIFSSLTRRIVVLNLAALLVLLTGILMLNDYGKNLLRERLETLRTQGEVIAAGIAASASVETDAITIDPEVLLEMEAGETVRPAADPDDLDFPIVPERVAPVLQRLLDPASARRAEGELPTREQPRARLYDPEGNLLLDSRHLYAEGQVLRFELPEPGSEEPSVLLRAWNWLVLNLGRRFPPYYEEPGGSGTVYGEVEHALEQSEPSAGIRRADDGTLVVSVAVPIQRFRATLGVLFLSAHGVNTHDLSASTKILQIFGVGLLVTTILSLLLASTIARPLQDLSMAAKRVRSGGVETREEIPDYADREDEIGELSASLRAMTGALYDRIDAIERFAGDVSHELKNPLTSLRSAVETLPLAKNEASRERLIEIINHDVRRLNRLISDIADASRLDAELALQNADPLDLTNLLEELVEINRQICADSEITITFDVERDKRPYLVFGHDLRIGQVITNLIENARSFVPADGGRIAVRLYRPEPHMIEVAVADNGPGIPKDARERIFERFYTDRPEGEAFGQNSGLGLSISRQIVEAHGGRMIAMNADEGDAPHPDGLTGAMFRIRFPAAAMK